MSRRTHRELAVGSHLVSERQREGERGTKAKRKEKEKKASELETKARHTVGTQS